MSQRCPIEFTLNLIDGKWKHLILKEISQEAIRYGRLKKNIPGISPKILIANLREMEENGLILRVVYPEVPPRVEYSLSEKGESLFSIFTELRRWALAIGEEQNVECSMCGKCIPSLKKQAILVKNLWKEVVFQAG